MKFFSSAPRPSELTSGTMPLLGNPRTSARAMDLVIARPEGLYCPPGDFYIDPGGRGPRLSYPRPRRPRTAAMAII
jgi:hypothetical protein